MSPRPAVPAASRAGNSSAASESEPEEEAAELADLFAGETAEEAAEPIIGRLLAAMDRKRPADAPQIRGRWNTGDVEEAQMNAFLARNPEWWRAVPGGPRDDPAAWCLYTGPAG